MKILLLEPYYTGSHAAWARGYARYSQHQIEILKLPGRFWKWRMHGGAVTLARKFLGSKFQPDLLLATDMLDLTSFLALTRTQTATLPTAIYFHENQLTYPWSAQDRDVQKKRDKHYSFINYISALVADAAYFNSGYHRDSFLAALPRLLKHFPDYNELESIEKIKVKAKVLPLGLDLNRFDPYGRVQKSDKPLILWNHRWEYDKNPADFFRALRILADRGVDFEVAILGENFRRRPEPFLKARQELGSRVVQFGYLEKFESYAHWLWRADLLPVTSHQDFFGISVMQAIYCHTYPLLPRRLAYPELIPEAAHPDYFYDNFDNLVARLEVKLKNIDSVRQHSLQSVAIPYDWSRMAHRYDKTLSELKDKLG